MVSAHSLRSHYQSLTIASSTDFKKKKGNANVLSSVLFILF